MDSNLRDIRDRIKLQAELIDNGLEHQVILQQDDYIYLWEQTERAKELEDEISSHAPNGRNYTNAQYVSLLQENQRYKEVLDCLEERYALWEHPYPDVYTSGYLQGLDKAIDLLEQAKRGESE